MYALMESKDTAAYREIFKFLCEDLFPKMKTLSPTFHLDFEMASRNAILEVMESATTQPCYFHWCQVQ